VIRDELAMAAPTEFRYFVSYIFPPIFIEKENQIFVDNLLDLDNVSIIKMPVFVFGDELSIAAPTDFYYFASY
jgi:hypothetical protein